MIKIIEWVNNLWNEGIWYQQFYILSGAACILFSFLSPLLLVPSSKVTEDIGREYRSHSSRHFFMRFRTNKPRELYRNAKLAISEYNSLYPLYVLKSWSSHIASISFGITFWLVAGSLVYEYIDSIPADEPSRITDYYEGEYYEPEPPNNNGIHHVDSHWVDGYERSDGTTVDGYWRGGDDGYYRSNPDGDLSNNLRP